VHVAAARQQGFQVNALVAQAAALGIGRVVKVGTEGDQTALVPVLDGGLVRRFVGEAAVLEIGVIGSQEGGPLVGPDMHELGGEMEPGRKQ